MKKQARFNYDAKPYYPKNLPANNQPTSKSDTHKTTALKHLNERLGHSIDLLYPEVPGLSIFQPIHSRTSHESLKADGASWSNLHYLIDHQLLNTDALQKLSYDHPQVLPILSMNNIKEHLIHGHLTIEQVCQLTKEEIADMKELYFSATRLRT